MLLLEHCLLGELLLLLWLELRGRQLELLWCWCRGGEGLLLLLNNLHLGCLWLARLEATSALHGELLWCWSWGQELWCWGWGQELWLLLLLCELLAEAAHLLSLWLSRSLGLEFRLEVAVAGAGELRLRGWRGCLELLLDLNLRGLVWDVVQVDQVLLALRLVGLANWVDWSNARARVPLA